VWSSRINRTRPAASSECTRLYWDARFYFYDVRKALVARLVSELGYSVLQTDTDVAWLANPYPFLRVLADSADVAAHAGPPTQAAADGADAYADPDATASASAAASAAAASAAAAAAADRRRRKRSSAPSVLISQGDSPFINAGVFYYAGVRPADGASWVASEVAARVHGFMHTPSLVRTHVPWAVEPFFANSDEQTIMNDALMASVANESTFASTALWETKRGGSMDASLTSFRALRPASEGEAGARPAQDVARVEMDRLIRATLDRQRNLPPAEATGLRAVLDAKLCTATAKTAAEEGIVAAPLVAEPGTRKARASPRSSWAHAPSWLFAHYPARFKPWRPTDVPSAADPGSVRCVYGDDGDPREREGTPPRPAAVMLHMAGVRSGAWHRRALMRGHAWWHTEADAFLKEELGWGRRGGGPLLVAGAMGRTGAARPSASSLALAQLPTVSPADLDALMAGLLLLAALSNRTLVLPEMSCPVTPEEQALWLGSASNHFLVAERLVRVDGTSGRCAWVPPPGGACVKAEYVTAAEFVRAQGKLRRLREVEAQAEAAVAEAEAAVAVAAVTGSATSFGGGRKRGEQNEAASEAAEQVGEDETEQEVEGSSPTSATPLAGARRRTEGVAAPQDAEAAAQSSDGGAQSRACVRLARLAGHTVAPKAPSAPGQGKEEVVGAEEEAAEEEEAGPLDHGSALVELLHAVLCRSAGERETPATPGATSDVQVVASVDMDASLEAGAPLRRLVEQTALLRKAAASLSQSSTKDREGFKTTAQCVQELITLSEQHRRHETDRKAEQQRRTRRGRGGDSGGDPLVPF
jgi:hypothetical protein